jgi:hypothetical protein
MVHRLHRLRRGKEAHRTPGSKPQPASRRNSLPRASAPLRWTRAGSCPLCGLVDLRGLVDLSGLRPAQLDSVHSG